jgi:hypothetical protein
MLIQNISRLAALPIIVAVFPIPLVDDPASYTIKNEDLHGLSFEES